MAEAKKHADWVAKDPKGRTWLFPQAETKYDSGMIEMRALAERMGANMGGATSRPVGSGGAVTEQQQIQHDVQSQAPSPVSGTGGGGIPGTPGGGGPPGTGDDLKGVGIDEDAYESRRRYYERFIQNM